MVRLQRIVCFISVNSYWTIVLLITEAPYIRLYHCTKWTLVKEDSGRYSINITVHKLDQELNRNATKETKESLSSVWSKKAPRRCLPATLRSSASYSDWTLQVDLNKKLNFPGIIQMSLNHIHQAVVIVELTVPCEARYRSTYAMTVGVFQYNQCMPHRAPYMFTMKTI